MFLLCLQDSAKLWITLSDLSKNLTQMPDISFTQQNTSNAIISVNENQVYQEIDGFGASLTDSGAWLFAEKLTDNQLNEVFTQLFSRDGIALSFLRQPLGSSDLATHFYSYDDLCNQTNVSCTTAPGANDSNLTHFSIGHDREYIIPMVKRALQVKPDIKVMVSPWSPPGWMKNNSNMLGSINGSVSVLLPQFYEAHANYLVKAMQAYEDEGIPIYAMTINNEAMFGPDSYGGMVMEAPEQTSYIKNFLYPAMQKANLTAKIMILDHNWKYQQYVETVYADNTTFNEIAGTAWHHYEGNASAMSYFYDKYPQKENWVTEASSFVFSDSYTTLREIALELIYTIRNNSKSYIKWALALDEKMGPHTGGCDVCLPVITVNCSNPANVTLNKSFDYYALGHATKFLYPSAVMIGSTEYIEQAKSVEEQGVQILDVAMKNPDGTIVLYILNNGTTVQNVSVQYKGQYLNTLLQPESISTFVWQGEVKKSLSGGAIAGITLGCVAFLALSIIIGIYIVKNKEANKFQKVDDIKEKDIAV